MFRAAKRCPKTHKGGKGVCGLATFRGVWRCVKESRGVQSCPELPRGVERCSEVVRVATHRVSSGV